MNGWWWLLIGAGAYISAFAGIVVFGFVIAAVLLLAAIIGDQRRCAHIAHGTLTWTTYCGEQR